MGFITIACFAIIVASLVFDILRKLYAKILAFWHTGPQIPSPPAYPILRHMPYFWQNFEDVKTIREWTELFKKDGIFVFDALLGNQRICIFKEEFLKQVLVTNCYKYARPTQLAAVFPNIAHGLFISNGKEHAWQRKLLNPAFSYSSVLDYIRTFDKHVDNLVKVWSSKTEKSLSSVAEVDIHDDFSKLTLDVIGETAFGHNFDTLLSGENELSAAVETVIQGRLSMFNRMIRNFFPLYYKLPFKSNLKVDKATKLMNSVVSDIISQKREKMKREQEEDADIGKDLLAKMMRLQDDETGHKMTDQFLHSQVFTFMVAGHETTSVGLAWTFYLLAKHPEIQAKAREEARDVLKDSSTITSKQLDDLTYIAAVINESLRMYPPAAVFLRETIQEDKIGGYVIPKGAFILIPVFAMHHSEENWPNHDQFIPERFLKTDDLKPEINNYNFMPFSVGPRNCIGRKFSIAEMKVTVAKLLNSFKFEIDPNHPEVKTRLKLTMKPFPKPILRVTLLEN